MKFVLEVPFFDGFESIFRQNFTIEAESKEDAVDAAKKFKEHLMTNKDERPYFDGDIYLFHIDDWFNEHRLQFPSKERSKT